MAYKCEMFMNCIKNFIGICKKQTNVYICEGTNMTYKWKVFESGNLAHMGITDMYIQCTMFLI